MKRILIVLLAFTALLFAEPQQPYGLMCELLVMPGQTTISDATPEFSWIYKATGADDFQTAYQILLADSKENIEKNLGAIWDSGKVPSPESVDIEFGGAALRSHTTYFWKVRTWNANDEPSAYSAPQKFVTGVLQSQHSTATYGLVKQRISPRRFVEKAPNIYFIDFGLGEISNEIEAKGVDLHVLMEAIESTHSKYSNYFKYVLEGYKKELKDDADLIIKKIDEIVKRGRYR